jgi:DNA/RNA endonuclease YhcR with UshA esterase domain
MNESALLKISLICSLVGILLLFFISNNLQVNEKVISELDETDIGSSVRLTGIVTNFQNRGSVILIDVAQLEEMQVVVFNSNFTLNKGDAVEIIGKVDEYEGNRQLIADKVILK